MKRLIYGGLIAAVVGFAGAPVSAAQDRVVEMVHWIEVTVPDGFEIEKSTARLHLREKDVRSPLTVTFLRGRMKGEMEAPQRRDTQHGLARWQVLEQETGGSGGSLWHLRIEYKFGTVLAKQQQGLLQLFVVLADALVESHADDRCSRVCAAIRQHRWNHWQPVAGAFLQPPKAPHRAFRQSASSAGSAPGA